MAGSGSSINPYKSKRTNVDSEGRKIKGRGDVVIFKLIKKYSKKIPNHDSKNIERRYGQSSRSPYRRADRSPRRNDRSIRPADRSPHRNDRSLRPADLSTRRNDRSPRRNDHSPRRNDNSPRRQADRY